MDIAAWVPSITMTTALAAAVWIGKRLITARLRHEFDQKLEVVRSELRIKETEIEALRSGALTAMASRQISLDKRRLEAVDQLWSAVTALGSTKFISALMTSVNFDVAAKEAERDPKVRELFELVGGGFDLTKIDTSGSHKAQPFVSRMAWALFSAYRAIGVQAVMRHQVLKSGTGDRDFLDRDAVSKLLKAALPHQTDYIEEHGEAGYHYLLQELEGRLLDELRNMLAGVEDDRQGVEQAATIVKLATDLQETG